MKANGDIYPKLIHIEECIDKPNFLNIFLRANIEKIENTNSVYYKYDEYRFTLKNREGIKNYIEEHYNAFIEEARKSDPDDNPSELEKFNAQLAYIAISMNKAIYDYKSNIIRWYKIGLWTKDMMLDMVDKGIFTVEEIEII